VNFEIKSSKTVYRGRVFDVLQDQLAYPDGRSFQIDVIQHSGAVAILPINDEGQIIFVRQYRHAVAQQLLELPAGTLEDGEDPLICAQRELREEIGMAAAEIVKLGEALLAPGYSSERMHLYLARDLSVSPLPQDDDETLEPVFIQIDRAFEMLEKGEFEDAKTQLGLLLARRNLQNG